MEELMKQYNEMFGESFPMIPIGWFKTDEEVIAIVNECLAKGKTAYDLGYAELEEDVDI